MKLSVIHAPLGQRRVNSPAFLIWAMRRRPDQVAKVVRALASKGIC